MKKFCTLCISLLLIVSYFSFPVSAHTMCDNEEEVGVSIFYQEWGDDTPDFDNADTTESVVRSNAVHNLADSNFSIYWTVGASGVKTTNLVKTNTTKIYVGIDLNKDASVTVELLDGQGNSLAEKTFTYYMTDERTATVKFTNLTASKTYRVKITNNSQKQIMVMGSVRDSAF